MAERTTPYVPPPPPRSAQKRSGCWWALVVMSVPLARTTVNSRTLSTPRGKCRLAFGTCSGENQ